MRFVDYLLTLDRERSITRAAEKLRMGQSSLSDFLQSFEKEAGGPLFFRTSRRLVPTELGNLYLDAARQMANVRMRTLQSIQTLDSSRTETIRIGVSPNRGAAKVMALYGTFCERYPNVRIDAVEGYPVHLQELLLSGKIDMFLCGYRAVWDDRLSYIKTSEPEELVIATHRSSPVVSRARTVPGRRLPLLRLDDLVNVPTVLIAPGTTIRRLIDERFSANQFYPLVVFETENVRLAANMVSQGTGVGFLPEIYVRENEDMLAFSFDEPMFMNLGVSLRRGCTLRASEKYLMQLLYASERDDPEPDAAWERQFTDQGITVREDAT